MISTLKRILNYVQYFSKVIAFLSSSYFVYFFINLSILNDTLSWTTFLSILKNFSSFIGFVCIIQRLKIVRSLQFFLESFKSDRHFKIKNRQTLERLGKTDLILIQKDALCIVQEERGFLLPKINFLTFLNRYYNVKIISNHKKDKIIQQFDLIDSKREISITEDKFYHDSTQDTAYNRLKKLQNCFFITECNRKQLFTQLIPIFQSQQYNIAYIYKLKNNEDNKIKSPNIISITFTSQILQMQEAQRQGKLDSWVNIKNTPIMQDHVQQILSKSFMFSQLYNVYMTQFLNNILVFLFLCIISISRNYSVDFYWSLIIIITARYIFFRIYKKIALSRPCPPYQTISHRRIIKYNLFFLFYYYYVVIHLQQKINVVLLFLCNAILRTEVLLFRIDTAISWGNVLKVNAMVGLVLIVNFIVKYIQGAELTEEFMLAVFVVGLAALLVVYGLMA